MGLSEKGEINIRFMTRDDINAVLALDRKIGEGRSRLSYPDLDSINPGGPADLSFVAEIDGNVFGFMIARLEYLMIPFTEVCVIQGILIDQAYRGRGTGGKIIENLFERCQVKGINTVRAFVPERDQELRQFVERYGFRHSTIVNYDKSFESE